MQLPAWKCLSMYLTQHRLSPPAPRWLNQAVGYFSRPSIAIQNPGYLPSLERKYVLRLLPKGTHDYNKFIQPSALAQYCRAAALNVDEITGLTYNPLTQTYKLDARDIDVNYLFAATRTQVG